MNKMAANFAATLVQAGRPAVPGVAVPCSRDRSRLRLHLYALLLVADALAMAFAFLSADIMRFGALEGYGATTFMVLFPIYVAVGFNGGVWSLEALTSPRTSAYAAVRALSYALVVSTLLFFTLKIGEDFSRLVFGMGSALALMFLAMGRLAFGHRIGERQQWAFRNDVVLLDGAVAIAGRGELELIAAEAGLEPDCDNPAMLDRIARALHRAERVTIACPPERRQLWARALAGANVNVELLVPELDSIGALGLGRHGGMPTLLVGCGPLGLRERAVKRLFDIAVSGLALVLLLPVLLVAALAVRLESAGPVFFRQARMGRGNRLFTVLKFRTMRPDASDPHGDRSVCRGDQRVTHVGSLLRRTSVDELPQLLNVLKGEMSVVGPRPHALGTRAEDRLLWAIDERYWTRHAIKPGLTGLAQVRGFRGATEKCSDVTDRVQADLEYVDGWHLGRDIAIVVKTLGVLVHPNAF